MAQRVRPGGGRRRDLPQGQQPDPDRNKGQEGPDLAVTAQGRGVALGQSNEQQERDRTEDHEQDRSALDRGTVEESKAAVVGAETTGGDGGHGVGDSIEGLHAKDEIRGRRDGGEYDVDLNNLEGQFPGARQQLLGLLEGLGAEQLHTADLQDRQQAHRRHHDPDPAKPLQQRPPQQEARRKQVQPGHDSRSRGGNAGGGLEHRLGEAQIKVTEDKGQRTEQAHQRPGHGGEDEGMPDRENRLLGPRGHAQRQPGKAGDRCRRHKRPPRRVAVQGLEGRRHHHRYGENAEQIADKVRD